MNFLVVQITPPAIANIGYKTYIIFAILNAAWVPVIYFTYPETKGLELEDVDRLFADKHGGGGGVGVVDTLFARGGGVEGERADGSGVRGEKRLGSNV